MSYNDQDKSSVLGGYPKLLKFTLRQTGIDNPVVESDDFSINDINEIPVIVTQGTGVIELGTAQLLFNKRTIIYFAICDTAAASRISYEIVEDNKIKFYFYNNEGVATNLEGEAKFSIEMWQ